ncbi:MAG: hypothetical protein ACI8ZN_001071 [Bacteroidia bacterium]|jgi:hypothetical protein
MQLQSVFYTLLALIPSIAFSQSDVLPEKEVMYTTNTFYSSRIVNCHTTELIVKKVLDFRINHRFGLLSGGYQNFWGLDNATMRMSFDYGLTDNLNVGIGRSTFEKTVDGFAKYRFLRQIEDPGNMPISLAYIAGISMNGVEQPPNRTNYFTSRLSYLHQIVIARKFNAKFSAQLAPTLLHRNLIDSTHYQHDVLALGIGLRQKILPSITLNLDYFLLAPDQIANIYRNPLSLGIDINTGWHTFQLHVTNARGTFEKAILTQTTGRVGKGDLHFGFNISREFHLGGYE